MDNIGNTSVEYYYPQINFKKANSLINARFNAGLLENQILAFALAFATFENDELKSHLTQGQVKKILGKTYGDFNRHTRIAAKKLLDLKVFYEDTEKEIWQGSNVITDVITDKGDLTVTFNKKFHDQIMNLKSNYTILSIQQLSKFDRVASFRLYETLKSRAYYSKNYKGIKNGKYKIDFSLSELRCLLGCVDMQHEQISQMFDDKRSGNINYDAVIEKAEKLHRQDLEKGKSERDAYPAPKWAIPRDLRKKVIEPACEEISQKTDINVTFEDIKVGKAHEVKGFTFYVIDNKYDDVIEAEEKVDIDNLIDEIIEYIDEKITVKDIKTLLNVAGNDTEKIKIAYDIAKEQGVDNLVGFLVSAIKNDYQKPINTKKKRNGLINNSGYDWDRIGEEVINR